MSRSLFIFGAGAVGGSLAVALSRRGVEIAGVYDTDAKRAASIAKAANTAAHTGELPEAAAHGDTVLVAVPDPGINALASRVARAGICAESQAWLHVSGSLPAETLAPLRGLVAGVGAFHPALVFSPGRVSHIPTGARFAVDGDPAALDAASDLAEALGGRTVPVAAQDRAIYHTAMVLASNYVVTLLAEAETALGQTRIPAEEIEPLLVSLASSAVNRSEDLGFEHALSGPIRRGDAQTVARNLQSLSALPRAQEIYRVLGRATLELARASSDLSDEQLRAVEAALNAAKMP